MRTLGLLTRRSTAPVAGTLIAVVSVALALANQSPGLDLWSELVTGLSSASLYTGTLAAGFAALEGGRWDAANRVREREAARSHVVIRLAHVATVIGPLVVGYAVALAILAVRGAITRTYGAPYPLWLLALAAALVLAAAFGYAVGVMGRGRWFTAPAAAIAFYGLFVLSRLASGSYGMKSLFPAITNTDSVFVRHIALTMIGQCLAFVGAALLIVTALSLRSGRGRTLLVAPGVTAVAGIVLVLATNGQYTTGYNARDFVCDTRGVTLCLNRGYVSAMDPLLERLDDLSARAAGTQLEFSVLEQNGEGVGDAPSAGARSIYLEQISDDGEAFALLRYVEKYGGAHVCLPGDPQTAELYVDLWLSGYPAQLDGFPHLERLENLRSLSVADGNAWLRAHSEAYSSCSLTFADLP